MILSRQILILAHCASATAGGAQVIPTFVLQLRKKPKPGPGRGSNPDPLGER